MIHSDYIAYFRDIATRQPDLLHTANENHFARIIYADWPTPTIQLSEFLALHKSGLHYPFMLIETWTRRKRATSSEHLVNVYRGSFFICDHLAEAKNFDMLEELFDKTDRIAGNIESYMLQEFEEHLNSGSTPKRYLVEEAFQMEHIGPFNGDKYGTRVEFQYTESASRWTEHDPDAWLPKP